jgi:hypothetical protein
MIKKEKKGESLCFANFNDLGNLSAVNSESGNSNVIRFDGSSRVLTIPSPSYLSYALNITIFSPE